MIHIIRSICQNHRIGGCFKTVDQNFFLSEALLFLFFLGFFSVESLLSQHCLCILFCDRLPFPWFQNYVSTSELGSTYLPIDPGFLINVLWISSNSAAVLSWSNISCVWVLDAGSAIINGDMKACCRPEWGVSLVSCRFQEGFKNEIQANRF